jgi:hypothetical protein
MSIYTENGYSSREEYLNLLREDYGDQLVNTFIPRYKPSDDFGGLIHAITEAYYDRFPQVEEDEDEDEEEDDDDWNYED